MEESGSDKHSSLLQLGVKHFYSHNKLVFVTASHFHLSIIYADKATAFNKNVQASSHASTFFTRMEVTGNDKHSSLIKLGMKHFVQP